MRSSCMSPDAARRRAVLLMLGAALSMAGCASPSAAKTGQGIEVSDASSAASSPRPARRSNVPTPFVTLAPSTVAVMPGEKVLLTAKPGGGEAMLFTVDWHVQEGAAGGSIEGSTARRPDGSYEATYTAPANGAGSYHVTASLHEYPAASAVATIEVHRR